MKKYCQPLVVLFVGAWQGLSGLSIPAFADNSASSVFNFTATFVGGSCAISVPASVKFNNGNAFSSAEIVQKTAMTNETFNLTLSQCAGWGLTPAIKVSGSMTTDFGEALFRDVMGSVDANGYGVLLETPGNTTFNSNLNLAANGTVSAKNDWSMQRQLNTMDTTLPIVASLRCGDCNYPGRHGGEFKATVTFDFVYE
ncbi:MULTISPECIES: fimbrial protein [Providencia]|uniref:type 1 fimbrial protein n=1 Tax=Providencia TaxID=586 RepID=UPI00083818E1|nr:MULTISPECIES: type 1 fimbrial protein [Providencia]MBP6120831.1 type 1 fimbrial protein [Providencia sp.]NIH23290.1 type 1 fimbrial protein [Providencia heimbachae]